MSALQLGGQRGAALSITTQQWLNIRATKRAAIDPLALSPWRYYNGDDLGAVSSQVTSWTDRSANAGHATQGAGASAPIVADWSGDTGKKAASFNGSQFLSLASSISGMAAGQGKTIWWVEYCTGANTGNTVYSAQQDATHGLQILTHITTNEQYVNYNGNALILSNGTPPAARRVSLKAVRWGAAEGLGGHDYTGSMLCDGLAKGYGQPAEVAFSATSAWIGTSYGLTYSFNGQIRALGMHAKCLSDDELRGVFANFHTPLNVACVGDSITLGATQTPYPTQLKTLYGAACVDVANYGIGGIRAAIVRDRYHTEVRPTARLLSRNVLVLLIGTNDIYYGITSAGAGITAQSIVDSVRAYVARAVADGWIVLACTLLPRSSFAGAQETARLTYNQAILSGQLGVPVDIAGIAELANPANATYYLDGTHPTTAGYALIAAAVKAKMDAI